MTVPEAQRLQALPRWLLACVPPFFRGGKLPYLFLFTQMMVVVVLVYALITPYTWAAWLYLALAAGLLLLTGLVWRGLSVAWAIHIGTLAATGVLLIISLMSGGLFSARLAWLLLLPLTPYYMIGRRAGLFWFGLVLLLQAGMAALHVLSIHASHPLGPAHVLPSFLTMALVTVLLIVVPMIFERMHTSAMHQSRQDQRALEAKRQELEQALMEREHFIAGVSHALRTPMNTILGFNALLLERVQDRPAAWQILRHTSQSAEHLLTVINDILDDAALRAGHLVIEPEVFDLHELLRQAFAVFEPRVRSLTLDYRLHLDPDLPVWVQADRHRLMQVLVNLLGNALKFTREGRVELSAHWHNPGVLFAVEDTGIGIAVEDQARLFNRFSQIHQDGATGHTGGTGLGLAISRELVQRMGGEIGFESEAGQGARFWFFLPLHKAAAPGVSATSPPSAHFQSVGPAWRFLIVDDHVPSRQLLRQVLLRTWPQACVREACDGRQALALLNAHGADLVLMDRVMPGMDGTEATRRLRQQQHFKHLPVIGITASIHPGQLAQFEAAGLDALMLKPLDLAALCQRMDALLRHAPRSDQS